MGSRKTYLLGALAVVLTIAFFVIVWWSGYLSNYIELIREVTLVQVATIWMVGVIVLGCLLIPYSAIALKIHEKDPRVLHAHAEKDSVYWPSLFITSWMARANLIGMTVIMSSTIARIIFLYEPIGPDAAEPAWSILLRMNVNIVLLMLLAMPTSFLLWVKYRIINRRYMTTRYELDSQE